ncbi:transposase [Ilyomonas limi]|uniref:Transposase n=1 Tax=Ilyomonas limi TaxID=2575867 RepID=A0A4U3KTG6_9BACT|nr:transposase [Ilyomonas limi]
MLSLWFISANHPKIVGNGEFPSLQTCRRYFQQWTKEGVIKRMLRTLGCFHAR